MNVRAARPLLEHSMDIESRFKEANSGRYLESDAVTVLDVPLQNFMRLTRSGGRIRTQRGSHSGAHPCLTTGRWGYYVDS